jgi:hypothetical protein
LAIKEARALHGDEIPVLPYVGVNLTDLTFTEDGNPSFFVDSNSSIENGDPALPLVNFGKMRLISQIISQIKEQQCSPDFTFEGTCFISNSA